MKIKSILVICLTLFAACLSAAIEEHHDANSIAIQAAKAFEAEKQVEIRQGEDVVFTIKVYQDEFLGHPIISASGIIDNTTEKKVKAIYSISFYDKDDKLIGCYQGSWDMEPNDDVNYGSGIIYSTPEAIKSVTNYKLRTVVVEQAEWSV